MSECKEFSLQGAPVSEGIAIGHVFFLPATSEELIAEYQVEEKDLIAEVDRYRKAVAKSKEDLLCLKGGLELEGVYEAAQIIGSHMQMLEDPLMTIHIEECIRKLRKNAESVFSSSIREYEKKFSKIKDVFFQQRVVDILDVSKRILGHLCGKTHLNLSEIPYNSIVFAKELIPSHTAALQGVKVGAFVTQQGGGSSHAALIARARGIPYISNIEIEQIQSMRIESVIVDGKRGSLIFNPLPATIKKYQEVSSEQKITYGAFEQDVPSMTQTMDGYVANVHVNIGNLKDLEEVRPYRPEGIGLIRTEYLFPDANIVFLSEEEQIKVYSKILEENMAFSVFRVFDIGGDKNPDLFLEHEKEQNPVLDCRGIRFYFDIRRFFVLKYALFYVQQRDESLKFYFHSSPI